MQMQPRSDTRALMAQLTIQVQELAKDQSQMSSAMTKLADQMSQVVALISVAQNQTTNISQQMVALDQRVTGMEGRERDSKDLSNNRQFDEGLMQRNWLLTYISLALATVSTLISLLPHLH